VQRRGRDRGRPGKRGRAIRWDEGAQVEHKLREFFELASLRCSHCGALTRHWEDAAADERSLAERGIRTVEDWDRQMDECLAWTRANKEAVLAVISELPDWKESSEALREVLEAGG
jgi:hypothetical protein